MRREDTQSPAAMRTQGGYGMSGRRCMLAPSPDVPHVDHGRTRSQVALSLGPAPVKNVPEAGQSIRRAGPRDRATWLRVCPLFDAPSGDMSVPGVRHGIRVRGSPVDVASLL